MASAAPKVAFERRDELTGLANMAQAREVLAGWQTAALVSGRPTNVHVMMLAVGQIESVNVAFGEKVGDNALVEVARRMAHFADDEFASDMAFVARVSGGTFLLAARERCSRERWQWLGEAVADAVALPVRHSGDDESEVVRLWPRVALMRASTTETIDSILDKLAEGLASAHGQGARRVVWSQDDGSFFGRRRAQLEGDLMRAIDRDEIEIVFQPQFSLPDDRLIGAEALARWNHPSVGRVGPSTLFALADRIDHTAQLSRHIIARAIQDASRWRSGYRLSLNVTPIDLSAGSFARDLFAMLVEAGGDPAMLTLEITEQMLVRELEQAQVSLQTLSRIGVKIALDDFGAGFCNFRYLKMLPLTYLKLDRSMIDGISTNARDLSVFRGIIAMADAIDLKVVAEGVESEEQRDLIAQEGCYSYQGFLKSEPLSAEAMKELIEAAG